MMHCLPTPMEEFDDKDLEGTLTSIIEEIAKLELHKVVVFSSI